MDNRVGQCMLLRCTWCSGSNAMTAIGTETKGKQNKYILSVMANFH